jgi:nitric oxide reductase subunit B
MGPKYKALLLFMLALVFGVLIIGGHWITKEKPPIPRTASTTMGETVFTADDVINGQNYYFSRGGQHIGTIWGHGAYLAPDWSADYLHRLGLYTAARILGLTPDQAKSFTQKDLDVLPVAKKAETTALVQSELRMNRYDAASGTLTCTPNQAEAFKYLQEYYTALFQNGNEGMGLQAGIVRTPEEGRIITAFFSWLAWAAGTERPGEDYTYTSNWPFDPLVGNTPLPSALIWSIVSVILLILGIGVMIFWYVRYLSHDGSETKLVTILAEPKPSPSQKATLVYFLVAMLLFVIQALLGPLVAHFTVGGTYFLGIPMGKILPYAAARTWHIQLSIFWIASCFLAMGLFIGPFLGREPKGQAPLVYILFGAVVVVVIGTLVGTWASVMGFMGSQWFLLGHQGYEYIELGRLWQSLLIVGMIIWLVLVLRAIWPAIKGEQDNGGLYHLLLYSCVAIPLFYMAGLMYGKGSHLADAEYWRWWVVHLWVEGFFEVFATVAMTFLLSRIGVISEKFGLKIIYISILLYLGAGVIGTFHHLYWTGTPIPIMALGAVFSALEIVPLSLLGFEVAGNLRAIEKGGQGYPYKWPLYFFIGVSFWNMVGAGIFGFLINPPIVLYYSQGLNTTPLHAHTALFGVYGFLAIALMLFSVRHIVTLRAWSDGLLKWSFWLLNIGLMAMTVLSLLPSGFYQLYMGVKYGMWYARSPEITSGPVLKTLSYLRVIPDMIFLAGSFVLLAFIVRAVWMSIAEWKKSK